MQIKYILRRIFCKKIFNTPENIMIDAALFKISQDFDIFRILQRMKEIEKIKDVIFNKDQRLLF